MGFRDRLKAEAEKYQQQFLGSTSTSTSNTSAPAPHKSSQNAQIAGLDASKCHFQATCAPPQPPSTPDPSIKIASITHLGNVTSLTSHIVRDLGFAGQIGSHVLLSYGDTIYCDSNLKSDKFRGMTSNSVGIATHDPLKVIDPELNGNQYPDQFVKVREDWGEEMSNWAVGITNVIETNAQAGEGIVYTLLNHRPTGVDQIQGAGVARVRLDFPHGPSEIPVPRATRSKPYLWNGEEPYFGDCGSIRVGDTVYAYGHKKDSPFVYLAKVNVRDVEDVECYEYWHGQAKGWRKDRLSGQLSEEESVFWQVNQGQVVWNEYLKRFLFIYCDRFWSSMLLLRSAPAPEGPWTQTMDVHKCTPITEGGTVYAAAPQPQFDPSGKSLVIAFTNHPNCIQAVKVEFE